MAQRHWWSVWLISVLGAACGSDLPDNACVYTDGRVYKPGDVFPTGLGCADCLCPTPSAYNDPGAYTCRPIGCAVDTPRRLCEPDTRTLCSQGPVCGASCCGQGERCDEGVCVCGEGVACGDGDICGSSGPIGQEGCGDTCCPPGTSCL